jgi:hypothetical protein
MKLTLSWVCHCFLSIDQVSKIGKWVVDKEKRVQFLKVLVHGEFLHVFENFYSTEKEIYPLVNSSAHNFQRDYKKGERER